jgi:AraC-like DNA-binding protein
MASTIASNLEDQALISAPFAKGEEVQTNPRYDWNCHDRGVNSFVIFQYSLAGLGRFQLGTAVHDVPAESAFIALVPEKSRYFYPPEGREPWTFCWLNFYNPLSIALWRRLRDRFGPVIRLARHSSATLNLLRLVQFVETRKFSDRFEASQEAYSFYMSCWRQLSHPAQAGDNAVAASIQYCREHFRDPISIKELASQSNLSREHFSRLFKAQADTGPGSFLRMRRLDAASELLAHSRLPLVEIALRCGFSSTRQFVQAYRKTYGRPPFPANH